MAPHATPLLLLLAAAPLAEVSAFACPKPTNPLPPAFVGSWSAGVGSSHYLSTADALYLTVGIDTAPDEAYCILDAFIPPTNAKRAFITVGAAANGGTNVDVACALLDLSAAPAIVQYGLTFNINDCPLATGLNLTGWTPGPPATPLACPGDGATLPAELLGSGSTRPAGFKYDSFLELSKGGLTLVNQGALVSTWCAQAVTSPLAGVTQVAFRNVAAAAAGGAADDGSAAAAWPLAGTGCAWLAADAKSSTLAFKWGDNGGCPTNITAGATTLPFNFTQHA